MRITARDIKKSYNGGLTPVLNGVSLDIDDGGLVVILGASGSGKSTLLTVLSGLERPDSGAVDCGGFELTSMTDKQLTEFRRKKVGFVFQQYYLLSHLTVEKNIKLGAALAGKTKTRRARRTPRATACFRASTAPYRTQTNALSSRPYALSRRAACAALRASDCLL
ncbi:MAG: ATP-binding cassette domain-containing protein [Clostridia bacterium]|nr:ATP-binding cassette domain-containing protein [Clostridia bacterium]